MFDASEADPPPYHPPLPSQRSRNWNLKTEFAGRRILPTPENRSLHGESWTEGSAALFLLADPRVRSVREQPPVLTFLDDGKERKHTVDLLAEMRDDSRTAVLVKPFAEREEVRRLIQLLAAQVPRSFADRWMHVHERHLTRHVVDNAGQIVSVLTSGPASGDVLVREVAAMVDAPTRIREVVRALGPDAYRAVVRLIYDGVLRVCGGLLIHVDATVVPAAIAGAAR